MKLIRPGFITRWLFPGSVSRIKTDQRVLYLTFDDGPYPGSTVRITGILNKYGIKCIFFCSGKQALKYPDLMAHLSSNGHLTGNHGYDHPDGWKISAAKYLVDVRMAAGVINNPLFRPPYGHLTPAQFRELKKHFIIFFWDLMPYDFDRESVARQILDTLKKNIRPGSVIVLHDTPDSLSPGLLEEFIGYALAEGYTFSLPDIPVKQKDL
jgi:peptidoglycan/xylan/chitin deacetylase (PgdA/CDA1 family)